MPFPPDGRSTCAWNVRPAEAQDYLELMLYENLPAGMREKALAMMEGFDPASVVATSRFIASGLQPFVATSELTFLECPTLLIRGDDPMHPAEVSDLYAASIRDCMTVPAATMDIAGAIGAFVDRCWQS